MVFGDTDLLMEAAANLLDNAVRFARIGGRVSIWFETSCQGALVRVADDGPGIDVVERQSVPRRFCRGEHGWGTAGIGIGLSLVTAILMFHEFHLTLKDAGPGCMATILCPGAGVSRKSLGAPTAGRTLDPLVQVSRIAALDGPT